MLPNKNEDHTEQEPGQQTQTRVANYVGFVGPPGRFSRIDDTGIAGGHRRGNAILSNFLPHGVIELAIGFDLAFEDVVLNGFACLFGNPLRLVGVYFLQ